jgi:hypothetical protein
MSWFRHRPRATSRSRRLGRPGLVTGVLGPAGLCLALFSGCSSVYTGPRFPSVDHALAFDRQGNPVGPEIPGSPHRDPADGGAASAEPQAPL